MDSAKYTKFFEKHFKYRTFEELNIPLAVAATNLLTGKVQYFNKRGTDSTPDCFLGIAALLFARADR